MSESMNILLSKRNSTTVEVNRSSPNLNTKSDCQDGDIGVHRVGEDNVSQSISKSQQTISTIFSMQNSHDNNDVNSTDASLGPSFKQLTRRESSLENLAEDDSNVQINASVSDNIVDLVNEDSKNVAGKSESSRFRRRMYSLFSCCSSRSKRSGLVIKIDDAKTENDPDKENHQLISRESVDKPHSGLSCLKLRKLFDMLDDSEVVVKRVQPTRQIMTSVPYRDGDKVDCHGYKAGDYIQSENGVANMNRSVLLGPIKSADQGKKCFIIDLDETLVHSSFKMVEKADFKVGVDIEGTVHTVYVLKRPYVDVFLQKMGRIFECVLFTASLAKYADPVTDFLDKWRIFRWRLFRESCVFHRGNYVKDLGILGRPTDQVAILDNSPASYMFHPDSAVQITSWFDDPRDTALLDLIPYLEQLAEAPSVPSFLASVKPPPRATVPVSVMLPLGGLPHNFIPSPPILQSSSHPITSASVPTADSLPSLVTAPHEDVLPFSPVPLPPCSPYDDLLRRGRSEPVLPTTTQHKAPACLPRRPRSLVTLALSDPTYPLLPTALSAAPASIPTAHGTTSAAPITTSPHSTTVSHSPGPQAPESPDPQAPDSPDPQAPDSRVHETSEPTSVEGSSDDATTCTPPSSSVVTSAPVVLIAATMANYPRAASTSAIHEEPSHDAPTVATQNPGMGSTRSSQCLSKPAL